MNIKEAAEKALEGNLWFWRPSWKGRRFPAHPQGLNIGIVEDLIADDYTVGKFTRPKWGSFEQKHFQW